MSTTSTGKTLNLTIEDLGGMLIELRPLEVGGEPWDISGKTFYGELYDELTDEKVGDIECSVTGEGRVLSKFPEMGRGRYSFAVYASDSGGATAVFVDGYVGYSAPAVTGGGFVDSVNRVVNVIVDGARRIAVWAHTSAAERAAERAEAAAQTAALQVENKVAEWLRAAVLANYAIVERISDLPENPTESQKKLKWITAEDGYVYVWAEVPEDIFCQWQLTLDPEHAEEGYEGYWMHGGSPVLKYATYVYTATTEENYNDAEEYAAALNDWFTRKHYSAEAIVNEAGILIKSTNRYSTNMSISVLRGVYDDGKASVVLYKAVPGYMSGAGWCRIEEKTYLPEATTAVKGIVRKASGTSDADGVVDMGQLQGVLANYVQTPAVGGYVASESVEHVEVVDELPASPDAGTLYIQTAE